MKYVNLFLKRSIDILGSGIGLIIILPLLIIVAALIKITSPGPVFFLQERLGRNGKVFRIIKFRTMVTDAEHIGDGLFVSSGQDNRITKFGRILRNSSLDELPQLINVISGTMSLVGPRPPVTYFPYNGYSDYPEWAKKRFQMRPGITGLAQIKTRTQVSWDSRIRIDNDYIDHFSFILDLKILIRTFINVIKKDNVYPEDIDKLKNNN